MAITAKRTGRPPGEPSRVVHLPVPLAKRLASRTIGARGHQCLPRCRPSAGYYGVRVATEQPVGFRPLSPHTGNLVKVTQSRNNKMVLFAELRARKTNTAVVSSWAKCRHAIPCRHANHPTAVLGTPMPYWTSERDEELKRHEAAGLSATKIAVLLGTTRGAILGRSNRLRGRVFKSDLERRPRRRSSATVQPSATPITSTTSQSSSPHPPIASGQLVLPF
jgi:GcrA cell cycle regulator